MKCSRWHGKIALYAGGDLDAAGARGVEKHIAGCASCRDLAESLSADRPTLVQLDARATEDLDLDSIQSAVVAEIGTRRRAVRPFQTAPRMALAAAVALMMAVSAIVLFKDDWREAQIAEDSSRGAVQVIEPTIEVPEGEPVVAVSSSPDASVVEIPAPRPEPFDRVARAEPPAVREAVVSPSVPAEPMTIKILTDDPEVVIYWIVEAKGDEENA